MNTECMGLLCKAQWSRNMFITLHELFCILDVEDLFFLVEFDGDNSRVILTLDDLYPGEDDPRIKFEDQGDVEVGSTLIARYAPGQHFRAIVLKSDGKKSIFHLFIGSDLG